MRTYRIFNLTIIGLLLYVLVFSLVSPVVTRYFPNLPVCYHKELTGNNCPFCGLTRDLNCILTGNAEQDRINSRLQVFLAVYALEWVIRITILLATRRFSLAGKTLPVIDISIHCILAIRIFQAISSV